VIKRRLRAVYGELALYHIGKERPVKAMQYLGKMESLLPLTVVERAFKATLFLIMRDFENARREFEFVVSFTKGCVTEADIYTYLYCKAHLHGMHGDVVQEGDALARALRIPVQGSVLRWLPLRH
jgi:hypothetical protein